MLDQETANLQSWGPLAPLAQKVAEGHLDGFELPYELSNLAPYFWPDGTQVLRLRSRGLLLFKDPNYENYGYTSLEEFQADVRKGEVPAKTVEGALSIGRARLIAGQPLHLSLQLPDVPIALRFLSQNMVEARAMRDQLQTIFPTASIRIAHSEFTLLFSQFFGAGKMIRISHFQALSSRKKKGLLILSGWAFLCLTLSILSLIGWISDWFEIIATALFAVIIVIAAAYLLEEEHIQNFLDTWKKKRETSSKPNLSTFSVSTASSSESSALSSHSTLKESPYHPSHSKKQKHPKKLKSKK